MKELDCTLQSFKSVFNRQWDLQPLLLAAVLGSGEAPPTVQCSEQVGSHHPGSQTTPFAV